MDTREISNQSKRAEQVRDMLKKDRRKVAEGYPRPHPLASIQDVRSYLDQDEIDCLLCGRRLRLLAAHLGRIHHMSSDDYKKMYGLPFKSGLSSKGTTEKLRAVRDRDTKATVAARIALITSAEVQTNKAAASQRTSRFKILLALQGSEVAPPTPRQFARDEATVVLEALERGEMLYPYLRRVKLMSVTTFKTLMREYPDLYVRYRAVAGQARRAALYGNTHGIRP